MCDLTFYLKEKLGKGSYGSVYRVITDENQEFAIKQCKVSEEGIPSILEPSIMSSIVHPCINHALDIYCSKDHVYILTSKAENDLGHFVRKNEIKDYHLLKSWCYAIACGVACLHSRGIIHGDIKGGNVLLYNDNTVKLTDFTLSVKKFERNQTFKHTVCTCTHRPLECLLGREWDESLDIWSLGCTFFEIIYGRCLFPFQGDLCKKEEDQYNEKMLKIRQRRRAANCIMDWDKHNESELWDIDYNRFYQCPIIEELKDINILIEKMLTVDVSKRINIIDIMNDPIFTPYNTPLYKQFHIINPSTCNINDINIEEYEEAKKEAKNCDKHVYKRAMKLYRRAYTISSIDNLTKIKACMLIASKVVLGYSTHPIIENDVIDTEKIICHYLSFRVHV